MRINDLMGTTGKWQFNIDRTAPVFFRRYTSIKDACYRTASIVTAPLVYATYSFAYAFEACFAVIDAMGELLALDLEQANIKIDDFFHFAGLAMVHVLTTLMSPVINLVDGVGSIYTTIEHYYSEAEINTASDLEYRNISFS